MNLRHPFENFTHGIRKISLFGCKPVLSNHFILNILVTTQVQGSIVPGSGFRDIKNKGFVTVNHEPVNLSRYTISFYTQYFLKTSLWSKSKKLFKSDEYKKLNR